MVKSACRGCRARLPAFTLPMPTREELQSSTFCGRRPARNSFVRDVSDAGDVADKATGNFHGGIEEGQSQASMEALRGMNAQQKIELIRFGASPGGQVMKAIGEEIQPALAAWLTGLMQDYEKRVEPLIEKIVVDALDKQAAQ